MTNHRKDDRIADCGLRTADCIEDKNPQSEIRNPKSAHARTLVALATYNEVENLPSLVDEILCVLPDADILVVDDNSPDGTGRWCNQRAAVEPRLRCLHRPAKQGLGTATLAAAHHAIDHAYDVFVTLDADWSHDPRHLPELVRATEYADVAIGSRYCPGGTIEGWPWHRRQLSRCLNGVGYWLLRVPAHDTSGAFRAYRVAKLRDIDLNRIQAHGYAYLEEILWHLARAGATFVEIPIIFRQRRAGKSKISVREAAGKLGTMVRLATRSHSTKSAIVGQATDLDASAPKSKIG
jgi:dolichol-phosphate mannosyltransferase